MKTLRKGQGFYKEPANYQKISGKAVLIFNKNYIFALTKIK